MSRTWVVIPAAGESKRFRDAGYDTPKPWLNIRDRNGIEKMMVEHVIDSIPSEESVIDFLPIIVATKPSPRIPISRRWGIHTVENSVGQTDTVFQAVCDLPKDDRVLICDCDMVLPRSTVIRLLNLLTLYPMIVAVTETFDPNASRVDRIPFPTRYVEKENISSYGIIGIRGFNRVGDLVPALERSLSKCRELHREPYISMVMNHIKGEGFAELIEEYTDWGTPERIRESGAEILS